MSLEKLCNNCSAPLTNASPRGLCGRCLLRAVMDAEPDLSAAQSASPEDHDSTPPTLPTLEDYRIIGPLAVGGMGTVWRAEQLKMHRVVALKLLSPAFYGSKEGRDRFDREIHLTARLEHPNIARVYDSGLRQGVYFYAMELVDGIPLDEYVQNNRLPTRQVLELMRLICSAVQHAHQLGIIHRDLKPGNLLVTADGQPRVLDFGLAKDVEGDGIGDSTIVGAVAGTPAYMSPEQAAGLATDTRTDVYSLGVILYRLLVGAARTICPVR